MKTLTTGPVAASVAADERASRVPALLRARGIRVAYGQTLAVDDVDLDLHAGVMVALVGRNGSGKSSLLRALAGHGAHASGEVVHAGPGGERLRIAYLVQRAAPRWDLPISVRQAVATARLRPDRWWKRPDDADAALIDDALARLGLTPLAYRPVGQLSGGQAQRLLLARALAQRPHVLLLDEPCEGLDVATTEAFLTALRGAAADGAAVCAALHQLPLAHDRFDRVVALDGIVLADGTPHEVLTPESLARIFGLAPP